MFNIIKGAPIRLDQHSCEIISQKDEIFRYPTFGLDGKVHWKGCFATPQTCISGLKDHCNKKKLNKEKYQELFDILQATLNRTEFRKDEKFPIIEEAPSHTNLSVFGGNMSPTEFRATFDPQFVMNKVYRQSIPNGDVINSGCPGCTSDGSGGLIPPDATGKSMWKVTLIPSDSKCTEEYLNHLEHIQTPIPRNFTNVVTMLNTLLKTTLSTNNNGGGGEAKQSNAICIYLHPDKKDIFGIGHSCDFDDSGTLNKLGRKVLGNQIVMGKVIIISKKEPSLSRKKRKEVKEQNEASVPAVPKKKKKTNKKQTTTSETMQE